MDKPTVKTLMDVAGLSKSYAWDILNDKQAPSLPLAALIFCKTKWRHEIVADMSDEWLTELAQKQPWSPPKARAA